MVHAHICRYITTEEANDEYNTFIIKLQTVAQTDWVPGEAVAS